MTYANRASFPISFADIQAATARVSALLRVVSDITVAINVWEALLAGRPVTVDGEPMRALNVYVDERLPEGSWHIGSRRP